MKLRPSGKAKASPKGLPARSKKKRYTVSLCDHKADEFVPYKQIDIIATDDNNAIQKADEWVASIPELIEEETWLIIKQEARSIRPKKMLHRALEWVIFSQLRLPDCC